MKITIKKTAGLFFILFAMLITMNAEVFAQCNANFTWVQTSNNVITFTNTSTGTNVNTWNYWSFGDGSYGYTQNAVHTYNIPGTYTACLGISDSSLLCQDSACYTITVTGSVICNLSATAYENSQASCGTCADGSAYSYPSGGTAPYTYSWNTVPVQTTSYANGLLPGTYTVCITDMNACTACTTVTIDTSGCNADFTWTQSSNNTITFTNTSSGGTSPFYYWNFGDGAVAYTQNPVHVYNIPGTYTACLSISDSTCNDSTCYTITVTGIILCNLTASAYENSTASCGTCADGSAYSYASGGTAPYTYSWNTVPVQTTSYANGLLPGTYTVCITDANACTSCATVTIDSSNTLGCAASFILYADSIIPHTYWGINQSSGVAPITYIWSWGDGNIDSTAYPTHTYVAAGYYSICLTLIDSTGCSSTFCDSMYLMRLTNSNSMITVNIIPFGTTGIKENTIISKLPIYPNPAKDYVVVGNVSSKEKLISATIISSTGTIVAKKTMKNNTFDVSKIPQGVYFAKFLHPDGKYSSAKLVIMR